MWEHLDDNKIQAALKEKFTDDFINQIFSIAERYHTTPEIKDSFREWLTISCEKMIAESQSSPDERKEITQEKIIEIDKLTFQLILAIGNLDKETFEKLNNYFPEHAEDLDLTVYFSNNFSLTPYPYQHSDRPFWSQAMADEFDFSDLICQLVCLNVKARESQSVVPPRKKGRIKRLGFLEAFFVGLFIKFPVYFDQKLTVFRHEEPITPGHKIAVLIIETVKNHLGYKPTKENVRGALESAQTLVNAMKKLRKIKN